ncbi:myb-like protein X [Palaemon carinicauda]|uniref:myb-like protein X n=1 Tax=Palaemon carinicauda TaxID=392227 RepID=UPI0035B622C6
MMETCPKDPRSHEPWWNDGCEDMHRREWEARICFEKNPSLAASKAFRKLQRHFSKVVLSAQRSYGYKMQRVQAQFGTDFPLTEENVPAQEGIKIKEKKKKKKSSKDDGTESEADNLDLKQEIFSLSHYISDQEELVNQMFSIIKGPKLEAMLPPMLRSIPLIELKNLCLHELRGMSKKRIICTMNGQEMDGSSESEEEEEEKDKAVAISNKNEDSPLKKTVPDTGKSGENIGSNQGIPAYLLKTIKVEDQDADSSGTKNSSGGKSVLELLELQMSARIIKTMLEKGDDGKALTEDAIVALMGTTAPTSQVANAVSAVKVEKGTEAVEGQNSKGDKEVDKKKSTEEKRHRDDDGKHSRSGHKKEHHRRRGSKRQRSTEMIDSEEEIEKKSRRDRSSDKRQHKKKKITRKEFEERMKRAKKNRSYRQRKSSEDEGKAKALQKSEISKDGESIDENKAKEDNLQNDDKKGEDGEIVREKEEGEAISEREEGEAVSEKEEGELDSDEEEEGACSPSDISSASYYSSSRSYTSRSRSRSYSRSYSRSPVRKRGRGRGRGRSRSRTKSRSRSRSTDRRKRDVGRTSKRTRRDNRTSGNAKMSSGIVSLPSSNNKQQKEEEDNWGQSCDIEFVDSEEDFDDNTGDPTKNTALNSKKPLPIKGHNYERASISFSLQKKTIPSITQNVDLDDLPLKSSSLGIGKEVKTSDVAIPPSKGELKEPDDIINLDSPKMPSDEILISSDSEQEMNDVKTKSVLVEKREQIHAKKVGKYSKGKEISTPCDDSTHLYKPGASMNNKNQASMGTSELELKLSNKSNDELNSLSKCLSLDQTCSKEIDADIMQKPSKDSTKRLQVITENSGVESRTEDLIEKGESAIEEKNNRDKIIEVESRNKSEEIGEDRNYITNESLHGEDQGLIAANTLSTADENRGTIGRVDVTSDNDQIKENLLPKNYEFSESQHGLDMKINTVEQEYEKTCLDITNETTYQKDYAQPNVIANQSDSTVELANKEAPPGTSHAAKEQDPTVKKDHLKPHEIRTQKVILEHLQESYNEEQESNQESFNEDQQIPSSKPKVVHFTHDSMKVKSPEGKAMHEEPSHEMMEVIRESEVKEIKEDKQETGKGGDWNEHKQTEQRTENYSVDKEETGAGYLTDNDDGSCNRPSTDDFYKGADELTFSEDEDDGSCRKEDLEEIHENRETEPIRINTGLIRKRVTRSKKVEMEAPGKSWTKKEKKKKDKPKDVLAMEGIGLLKKTLIESAQSPSKEKEGDSHINQKEISEQTNDDDTCTSWGISSVSSKEETSIDSRVQSPKDNVAHRLDASPSTEKFENNEIHDASIEQKKISQDTEIIGVIEANSSSDTNQMDDIDIGGSSWSMRWLQSEKVQKVVSSSKMLSRIRKKIQKKDKATKVITTSEKPFISPKKIPDPGVPIIGSIEEYERLFGMKAKKPIDEIAETVEESSQASHISGKEIDQPSSSAVVQEPQKKRTNFGSDDEGEDSEEEALWSKILGK